MPQAVDATLMQQMAQGDRGALATLYDRYASRVFGLILTILKNRSEAEDVLQETFLQLWRQAARFDEKKARPEVWILLLTRSRAIDRLRQRQAARVTTQADLPEPTDVQPTADGAMELCETRQEVCSALCTLPADQQEPIRLAFYEGLTHVEIAARLGKPLGTIKTRIRNGMMQLRQTLTLLGEGVS